MRFASTFVVSSAWLGLCAAAAAGCGGGDAGSGNGPSVNGLAISSQNLSGTIGGKPWALATAQSESFLSDAKQLFITMYATAFNACEFFAAPTQANEVLVKLPRKVGSYDLSLAMNATLYDSATSNNWIATRGRIVIDSITPTAISGGAHIIYNAANTVDGQFSATICP